MSEGKWFSSHVHDVSFESEFKREVAEKEAISISFDFVQARCRLPFLVGLRSAVFNENFCTHTALIIARVRLEVNQFYTKRHYSCGFSNLHSLLEHLIMPFAAKTRREEQVGQVSPVGLVQSANLQSG